MTARNNPWLGLKSYEEDDRLYGRNKETEDLTNVIINSFNTTIYGKSGIGKTSLLKAGIFPMLRYEDFCPIYIRLEHDVPATDMLQYYISQIDEAIKRPQNGVVVSSKTDKDTIESLDDIFTYYNFETTRRIALTPVYIFDQFEEIFTLNEERGAKSVNIFFKDLSNILNDSIHEQNYRIVFCLREDYLYCVERYSETIPAFKRNRYNLKDLSRNEALEVITMPVPNLVTTSVADEILQKIASGMTDEVNATILSLYLSQLYDKMQKAHQSSISSDILHTFGDDIISSFYFEHTKGISDNSLSYLEERLVTNGGYRHNIPLEDALGYGVLQREIDLLREKRILNVQPRHNNVLYIEFTHDVLCPIIVKHRTDRQIQESARKSKRKFLTWLMVSIIVIAIISIFLFMYADAKASLKAKEQLEQKNTELLEKNNSIELLIKSINHQNDSIIELNQKYEYEASLVQHQNDSIARLNLTLEKEAKLIRAKDKSLELRYAEIEKKDKELELKNIELENTVRSYRLLLQRKSLDVNSGQTSEVCTECNGTGLCTTCAGTGHVISSGGGIAKRMQEYQCIVCNGSGKCCVCHGTGRNNKQK